MILKSIFWFFATVLFLGALVLCFVKFHPVFGGVPDEISMAKIRASKAYNGKTFENAQPTVLATSDEMPSMLSWIYDMIFTPEGKNPSRALPSVKFEPSTLENGDFVWFGHSSVLFRINDLNIITDPVFYRASPIFVGGAPFAYEITPRISDLPDKLCVVISHDHYDHLDMRAIREIDAKAERYIVPLGVRAHLLRWGVQDEKITELDLGESARVGGVSFTLERARHFSGRFHRNTTLWGSYAIIADGARIFYGGDSGDGEHFAQIAQKYGHFDIAMLENGAYNRAWAQIHSMPEQSAKNASVLGARAILPIHWAKFDLAYHKWSEPMERLVRASKEAGAKYTIATPLVGEVFNLSNLPQNRWWESVK